MVTCRRSWAVCVFSIATLAAAESRAEEKAATTRSDEEHLELFWIDGEGGVESANLRTFDADVDRLTVGLAPTTGQGLAGGVGAGVRLWFVTLGARGRVGDLADTLGRDWRLWTLDAEAGLRIPLHRVEPHITLAGGYAGIGNSGDAVSGLRSGLDVSGANVRAGAGLDVYATPALTIGGDVTCEALFLSRRGVPLRDLAEAKRVDTINDAEARILEANGASAGGAVTFTAGLGLHF